MLYLELVSQLESEIWPNNSTQKKLDTLLHNCEIYPLEKETFIYISLFFLLSDELGYV